MDIQFDGYKREWQQAGTRNYVAVMASVICSTTPVMEIAKAVPGVVPVVHQYGCAQVGDDMSQTRRTLVGVAANPNVRGVLVVGLGCETNQARVMAEHIPPVKPIEVMGIQEMGGSDVTVESGIEAVQKMVQGAETESREPIGAEGLTVGIIGVEADDRAYESVYPAFGRLVDRLTDAKATVIAGISSPLAPYGDQLALRAADEKTAQGLKRIGSGLQKRRWLEVTDTTVQERPWSEQEKARAEKEAVFTGSAPIQGLVTYGESVEGSGLHFMAVPTNPVEAMSGLVAGGANVILVASSRSLFTGTVACPVITVAPKSERMNALGDLVDCSLSGEDPEEGATKVLKELLEVASGKQTQSEMAQLSEFAISQVGTPF